ncbi:MAG TPA: mycothione reductase [Nocardioides sp.]
MSDHYDLVVIGSGSGNTIVDDRFSHLRVAIVERDVFGGTCVNRGCIPSKMYVHAAELLTAAARGPALAVRTSAAPADPGSWTRLRDRVTSRIDAVARGGEDYRRGLDFVDVLRGTARFTAPGALEVTDAEGGVVAVTADQVVLATGGRPVVPDVPGLHDVPHVTSDTVMLLDALPRRMAVLGGGYVGCELAHVFAALGVEVVQVESEGRLLAAQDADVADVVTRAAAQRWELRLGTRLERAVPLGDSSARLELADGSAFETDLVLVAVGRRTNADLLDLDRAGVPVDDEGRIVVDEHQRAGDGVWALGDASAPAPLKHVANQDARVVQHNLLHPDDLVASDHRHVPQAVFTEPQVAAVGLTEAAAREQGIDLAVGRTDVADTTYGWALQAGPDDVDPAGPGGFAKLLADRSTGLLVGAHVVGPMAATLLQPLVQAMSNDVPVRGLARGQYWIHPAPTELVENALLALEADLDA